MGRNQQQPGGERQVEQGIARLGGRASGRETGEEREEEEEQQEEGGFRRAQDG